MATARTPDSVRMMQVIEIKSLRGAGTNEDMSRIVTQYWSLDGQLLAETDPVQVPTRPASPPPPADIGGLTKKSL